MFISETDGKVDVIFSFQIPRLVLIRPLIYIVTIDYLYSYQKLVKLEIFRGIQRLVKTDLYVAPLICYHFQRVYLRRYHGRHFALQTFLSVLELPNLILVLL